MRSAPDRLRGRMLGAIESARNLAFGLGVVGAGALVGLLGPRPVYAAVGLTMALGTLPVASLVGRQRLTSLKKVESCPSALRS
jgi:hypothetical protein